MGKHEQIKAVIIDDEKGCIKNLEYHLEKFCSDIEVVATGSTLEDAKRIFKNENFDVAFLDIEIFDNNIFHVITLNRPYEFKIIFVTAHEKYAITAVKEQAIDYILKPLSEQDITECYKRIKQNLNSTSKDSNINKAAELRDVPDKKIILKQNGKVFVIKTSDICYLQAHGAYTSAIFSFDDAYKSVTLSKSINRVEIENNASYLFRVHKSYLINTEKIIGIIKNDGLFVKMINEEIIPVAKRRVQDFLSFLNGKHY